MHTTCTTRQVLLVLLCPLCLVAYACARFGSKWKLYLRYRLSHSNPSVSILYLHKDARDDLRTQLFDFVKGGRKDVDDKIDDAVRSKAQSSASEETKEDLAPETKL